VIDKDLFECLLVSLLFLCSAEASRFSVPACPYWPRFNPLIVDVAGLARAETFAVFNRAAHRATARFWLGR
jgi:hypothetical protein